MPAKDTFHDNVVNALIKDGWLITHDPFYIKTGRIEVYVDLGAEKLIGAEKNGSKIAVEIKSFVNPSFITAFYEALGKFLSYEEMIKQKDPNRILFIAVPNFVFDIDFNEPIIQTIIKQNNIRIIIFNPQNDTIVKWIK